MDFDIYLAWQSRREQLAALDECPTHGPADWADWSASDDEAAALLQEAIPLLAAVSDAVATLCDSWLADDLAGKMNQSEVEPLAGLLHLAGATDEAVGWLESWIDSEVECGEFRPGQWEVRHTGALGTPVAVDVWLEEAAVAASVAAAEGGPDFNMDAYMDAYIDRKYEEADANV